MATEVVPPHDPNLLQENTALHATNVRLEAQIEDLIKERDQVKRSNERLRARLEVARNDAWRSERILEGVRECKPRALWSDVLLPMVSSNCADSDVIHP